MNGHCGITGSTYRPVEPYTPPVAFPQRPSGLRVPAVFVACELLCAVEGLGASEALYAMRRRSRSPMKRVLLNCLIVLAIGFALAWFEVPGAF